MDKINAMRLRPAVNNKGYDGKIKELRFCFVGKNF
jgi:hypothetical protein